MPGKEILEDDVLCRAVGSVRIHIRSASTPITKVGALPSARRDLRNSQLISNAPGIAEGRRDEVALTKRRVAQNLIDSRRAVRRVELEKGG